MFIDYVSIMLINMAAGSFLLAYFFYKGIGSINQKGFVPAFGTIGLVAMITGLHMSFTWPLPGSYNEIYGSTTILLGIFYLGVAWAIAKDWDLRPIGIYAFFSSLVPLVIGPQLIILNMTQQPLMSGIGFILSGVGGILVAINLCWHTKKTLILITVIVLVIIGILWAFTGYMAFWSHIASNAKWVPAVMGK